MREVFSGFIDGDLYEVQMEIYIHAAPRQGPPAPRSQGVINASGFV